MRLKCFTEGVRWLQMAATRFPFQEICFEVQTLVSVIEQCGATFSVHWQWEAREGVRRFGRCTK